LSATDNRFYYTIARTATIWDGVWIDNWIYWTLTHIHSVTVYTVTTLQLFIVFPRPSLFSAGPRTSCRLNSLCWLFSEDCYYWNCSYGIPCHHYSYCQLFSWLQSLGTDPVGNTALTLLSGQPLSSNAFFLCCLSSRYQVTSTPQAYGVHVTIHSLTISRWWNLIPGAEIDGLGLQSEWGVFNGPKWLRVFVSFTWGWKQIEIPKYCVLLEYSIMDKV
jgi:hypothetical protein